MKITVTFYNDEDGVFIADCSAIPGCVSQGRTLKEAEKNIKKAMKECLKARAKLGLPLTVMTREIEVHV